MQHDCWTLAHSSQGPLQGPLWRNPKLNSPKSKGRALLETPGTPVWWQGREGWKGFGEHALAMGRGGKGGGGAAEEDGCCGDSPEPRATSYSTESMMASPHTDQIGTLHDTPLGHGGGAGGGGGGGMQLAFTTVDDLTGWLQQNKLILQQNHSSILSDGTLPNLICLAFT